MGKTKKKCVVRFASNQNATTPETFPLPAGLPRGPCTVTVKYAEVQLFNSAGGGENAAARLTDPMACMLNTNIQALGHNLFTNTTGAAYSTYVTVSQNMDYSDRMFRNSTADHPRENQTFNASNPLSFSCQGLPAQVQVQVLVALSTGAVNNQEPTFNENPYVELPSGIARRRFEFVLEIEFECDCGCGDK